MNPAGTRSGISRWRVALAAAPLVLGTSFAATAIDLGTASAAPSVVAAYGATSPTVSNNGNGGFTASGSGFPPNTPVTVSDNGTVVGSGKTDSHGNYSVSGQYPNGACGNQTITVSGGGYTASTVETLPACASGTSTAGATSNSGNGTGSSSTGNGSSSTGTGTSSSSGLAFTGTDATLTASIGAGLIAGGGILVMGSRRRRRAAWK
jgi:hypothetical protein